MKSKTPLYSQDFSGMCGTAASFTMQVNSKGEPVTASHLRRIAQQMELYASFIESDPATNEQEGGR